MVQKSTGVVSKVGSGLVGFLVAVVDIALTFWYRGQNMHGLIVNHGVAFGWGSGKPQLAQIGVAVGLAVLGFLYWRWYRARYPLAMMLGGAIANAISRIRYGGVVDYWHVAPYPFVFNAADVAIRVGVLWLLVVLWTTHGQVGRQSS